VNIPGLFYNLYFIASIVSMNTSDYLEVVFEGLNTEQEDMLIALLSDYGFEGFEEGERQLRAYINENDFDEKDFTEMIQPYVGSYGLRKIQSQNWNAMWEEHFEPVMVHDFVGIRAHFHPSLASEVQYEIVITPKMSFGTGHHATTFMMIEQMQHLDFHHKQVLDFGTGTGVLAILSEKLGAAHVLAIDIDEWSIENAKENIERNNCASITIQQADGVITNIKYDIILANINKNIILQNLQQLNNSLDERGCLLLSGLLVDDEEDIVAATERLDLKHRNTIHKQQWTCMLFAR
jgi:ribosomal protein L11 methyltransferase